MAISKIVTNSVDSGVTLTSPTIASPTISAPVLSGSATGTYTIAGTYTLAGTPTTGASLITSGTAQATTSGTSKDFTGIPSWVKRITVMFNGVGTSATSLKQIQLGSTTIVTTGYTSSGTVLAVSALNSTIPILTGFVINSTGASERLSGSITLNLQTSNTWVGTHAMSNDNNTSTNHVFIGAGQVSLGGVLDRIRITTVNGTDTFAAGSINILFE